MVGRRIVLVGDLGAAGADELLGHCALLRSESGTEIVVDMSAVRACDQAGLDALLALHLGQAVAGLVVAGARWSQFFDLLIEIPPADLNRVCDLVRRLVPDTRRTRHAAAEGLAVTTATASTSPKGVA